ncbi:hypothetical protein HMPREF3205_02284 [Streptococcus pasteurianus]|jgi:hypothetical protein|nr:hypothetical protein HMPREF3205_02284 [Streptococcus pasteurianus]
MIIEKIKRTTMDKPSVTAPYDILFPTGLNKISKVEQFRRNKMVLVSKNGPKILTDFLRFDQANLA